MVEYNLGGTRHLGELQKALNLCLIWVTYSKRGFGFPRLVWRKDKIALDLRHFVCCSVGCLS
jgi:hypothetical protein